MRFYERNILLNKCSLSATLINKDLLHLNLIKKKCAANFPTVTGEPDNFPFINGFHAE